MAMKKWPAILIIVSAFLPVLNGCGGGIGWGPPDMPPGHPPETYYLSDLEGNWESTAVREDVYDEEGSGGMLSSRDITIGFSFDALGNILSIQSTERALISGKVNVSSSGHITGHLNMRDKAGRDKSTYTGITSSYFMEKNSIDLWIDLSCLSDSGIKRRMLIRGPIHQH